MSVHPGSTNPDRIDAPHARLRPFTLSYRVNRASLGAHAPDGNQAVVELQIAVHHDGAGVRLLDRDSHDERSIDSIEHAPSVLFSAGGWMHIDIPGVLSCSIADAQSDGASLVYARTPVLGKLGVPGGRFDPPTIQFHD